VEPPGWPPHAPPQSLGARTVLVSAGEIGGECTFTGCVPSEALIQATARGASFKDAIAAVRAADAAIAATETADVLVREGIDMLQGRALHFRAGSRGRRAPDARAAVGHRNRFLGASGWASAYSAPGTGVGRARPRDAR
jgi:hypothetical protein